MTKEITMQGNQRQALQYAYLAGLIDGEGCLRITRDKSLGTEKQGHKSPKYAASISMHMVTREPLDFFASLFPDGYLVYEGVRDDRPNQRPTYCWRCQNRFVVQDVIEKIYPYLLVKNKQADLILEYCKGYIPCQKLKGEAHSQEIQRREDLYQKMKKLNAVGAAATTNSRSIREYKVIV